MRFLWRTARRRRSLPWSLPWLLPLLLPQSAEVRLRTAPGGHLAVLAGPTAKTTTWQELDAFQNWWDGRQIRKRGPNQRVSVEEAGAAPARPQLHVL